MSRVTYSDLLPTMKNSMSKIETLEKNIQELLETDEKIMIELKTFFSLTDLFAKKELWSKYNVSLQEVFEIEQLLSFVSSNEKEVLFKQNIEANANSNNRLINLSSEFESNFEKEHERRDEIYGVSPDMYSSFIYEEKLNLKNFKIVDKNTQSFFKEIEENQIKLTDLNIVTNVFCIKTKCSIKDIEDIFKNNVSLLRKILSTKVVEEKEVLKPKVHYRNFRLSFSDQNVSRLRNVFVSETLIPNESSKEKLKKLKDLTDNLDYKINSKLNVSLDTTILFEEQKYFDIYLTQIRNNIIPNLSLTKVMSNYNDIILKEIAYKKSRSKYLEPTYYYNEYLANSLRDLIKNNKVETVEFNKAHERYKEIMVEHLLLAKEQPNNNIEFLKFVEDNFNSEQVERIQKKYPNIFFTEEDKEWFIFEYDNEMMNFTIKEGYFLLNRVDILSVFVKTLLDIWSETEDMNLPKDIIFNIKKTRVFAYAKQPEKFKMLSENQKNNVIIGVFDTIVSSINNKENENYKDMFRNGMKEISTLIALKNVKKEASELISKKKI